jgi:hypothetical protein
MNRIHYNHVQLFLTFFRTQTTIFNLSSLIQKGSHNLEWVTGGHASLILVIHQKLEISEDTSVKFKNGSWSSSLMWSLITDNVSYNHRSMIHWKHSEIEVISMKGISNKEQFLGWWDLWAEVLTKQKELACPRCEQLRNIVINLDDDSVLM